MEAYKGSSPTKINRYPVFLNSVLAIIQNKDYLAMAGATLVTAILYSVAYLFQHQFSHLVGIASYLAWHSLFEISGALVCFAIFIVSFFTYDQTKDIRSATLGSIFLAVGMMEIFHLLSFRGMPDFFVGNKGANRPTTLWIVSRITASLGFVISAFYPDKMKAKVPRWIFIVPPVSFSLLILIIVTYYPGFLPVMYQEGTGLTPVKIALEYAVIALFAISIGRYLHLYQKTRDRHLVVLCAALTLNIFSELAFTSYYSVYDIYNYLGHVLKIIAYFLMFRVIFIHNVRKPYVELADARDELMEHVGNQDLIVEQRTRQIRIMNETLLNDLEYARDIQKAMLPLSLPNEENVSFSARYFPAERVSGDFYNAFDIDDRYIGLYVGDVSGHGVPAAMLTIFLNQCVKNERESPDKTTSHVTQPSIVLNKIYESFNNTNFNEELYIVLIYGVYDRETGLLTYASAGLNTFPILMDGQGSLREISLKGFPICKSLDYCDIEFHDETLQLTKGDRVLFYTDGMVEMKNETGERISEHILKESLAKNKGLDAEEISDLIVHRLFDHLDMSRLNDDITFLVMEVKGGLS